MIIDNKISKTLNGPTIFLGITFLFLGVVFIFQKSWIAGAGFTILATFLLFTSSGIIIDTEKKRIKPYYNLFGIYKHGTWESLDQYVGVTLVPMKKTQAVYSRSNRQTSSTEKYFEIFLVNKNKRPAVPIKKCKTPEVAQNSLDEFSIWLKMPVFSVRN